MSAEWKSESVGNVATLQRGFDLPSRLRKPGKVLIITSSGIEFSHYEAKVKGPGVVTGRYGTIGEVFFVQEDFWPLNTTLYVRDFHGNNPRFISYLLRTIDFKTHSGKSGVPGVNRNDLHEIVVPLPPTLAEQQAIAEALSDADALIESLEQLLTKKRQIKTGAMQELLTGKKRLPGFSGAWTKRRIDEMSDVDPENLPSTTKQDFKFNYISLEQVDSGRLLSHSEVEFGTAPSRARRVLRHGDVLMSTVRPNLKAHLLYLEQIPNAVCSTGFAVLRTKSNVSDPGFLFAHLFGHAVNEQIEENLAGSNYPAINSRDVRRLEIDCPSSKGGRTNHHCHHPLRHGRGNRCTGIQAIQSPSDQAGHDAGTALAGRIRLV